MVTALRLNTSYAGDTKRNKHPQPLFFAWTIVQLALPLSNHHCERHVWYFFYGMPQQRPASWIASHSNDTEANRAVKQWATGTGALLRASKRRFIISSSKTLPKLWFVCLRRSCKSLLRSKFYSFIRHPSPQRFSKKWTSLPLTCQLSDFLVNLIKNQLLHGLRGRGGESSLFHLRCWPHISLMLDLPAEVESCFVRTGSRTGDSWFLGS